MNLLDLLNEETLDQYLRRLSRTLKIPKLGKGAFADVFQHPVYHNVAVKLVQEDPEYIRYVDYCLKYPDNPWLPKVIGRVRARVQYHEMSSRTDPLDVVFFQKLERVSNKEVELAVRRILLELPALALFKHGVDTSYAPIYFQDFEAPMWGAIAEFSKDAGLRQFAKLAVARSFNDIHNGNVMARVDEKGGRHLVFTDPVAS